jgi:hypothetical protein
VTSMDRYRSSSGEVLSYVRPRWLAPPGPMRRLQLTAVLLVGLAAIGVIAGAVASRVSTASPWVVGVGAALAAELAGFAIPVRVRASRGFELPATPMELFEVTKDPIAMARLSPMRLNVSLTGGEAGSVGSTYEASSSGLTMRTKVLESEPGRRIVTETKSRLIKATIVRRYAPCEGGTRVDVESVQRVPLAGWMLAPVFRSEVDYTLRETERRLRAYFGGAEPPVPTT